MMVAQVQPVNENRDQQKLGGGVSFSRQGGVNIFSASRRAEVIFMVAGLVCAVKRE